MLGWNNCGQPKEGKNHSQGCGEGQVACLFEDVVPMNYMVYFNFFACVLVPLLLMLGVYLRIFLAARRQLKQMESQPLPGERARSTLQKEVHAAKSLAIIVGLFALCWLPLHIINCFTFFCPDCNHAPLWLMYLAIVLSHTNSVVNPFIYAYRIREFRQTFRKIIRSHVLRQQEPFKAAGTSARVLAAHGSDGEQVSLRLNGHPPGVWANGSAPHPERRPNGYALGLVSGGTPWPRRPPGPGWSRSVLMIQGVCPFLREGNLYLSGWLDQEYQETLRAAGSYFGLRGGSPRLEQHEAQQEGLGF
uniref:Adenosine receptor A2 n=1 Tax=Nomascus leucogenys TaxID=61853 RepID=A0A2I3G782_NOMLE